MISNLIMILYFLLWHKIAFQDRIVIECQKLLEDPTWWSEVSIFISSIVSVVIYMFLIFGTFHILRTNFSIAEEQAHSRLLHCAKIKYLPRHNYTFLHLLLNARHGNTRWLVSCSFAVSDARDGSCCRFEDKSNAREREREKERAGVSRGCRWILEWKNGSAKGRKKQKKKESGSETVFDCVAFSLSRLFRNEYRQWPTQRRFFSSRLERRRVPSNSVRAFPLPPRLLRPIRSSGHISLS